MTKSRISHILRISCFLRNWAVLCKYSFFGLVENSHAGTDSRFADGLCSCLYEYMLLFCMRKKPAGQIFCMKKPTQIVKEPDLCSRIDQHQIMS